MRLNNSILCFVLYFPFVKLEIIFLLLCSVEFIRFLDNLIKLILLTLVCEIIILFIFFLFAQKMIKQMADLYIYFIFNKDDNIYEN